MEVSVSFFVELDNVERVLRERKDLKRLKFLAEVKEYAKGCSYINRKNAQKVMYYWTRESKEVALLTGLKDGDVRTVKVHISRALYNLFGHDFLSMIRDGTDEEFIECQFKFHGIIEDKDSYSFFPREFVDLIRYDSISESFNVADCRDEYLFLRKFCTPSFKKELSALNKNKLAFLLSILDGKAGTPKDRYSMTRRLSSIEEGESK